MATIALDPSVNIETRRCYRCGRWWALETGHTGRCPKCADDKADQRNAELEAARRSIRSLKGALTKARARRAS